MGQFINYNGNILKAEEVCISPDNRSFRYGDGFFETMKVIDGRVVLQDLHFERLFRSLEILQFEIPDFFSPDYFSRQISDLILKNDHQNLARLRITFFRGEVSLTENVDHFPNFIIQNWSINATTSNWLAEGLVTKIFTDARIAPDTFSSVKTNNYLPYAMAAINAKKEKLDDCILINAFGNICDATIANVFIVTNGTVITPPLQDGPVAGVMRRFLLQKMREHNIPVYERSITTGELLQASEVFFTNIMFGIKWVKQVNNSQYGCQLSQFLFDEFVVPLWRR